MFTASGFCVHMVIRIPLFLLLMLLIQRTDTENKDCTEAAQTVTVVPFCPINKEEVDKAARAKNCSQFARKENCSSSNSFEYHCVINGYRNETLEVCAPKRVIHGYCTEFNEVGGVIQRQTSASCNLTFPKCDELYNSTAAYKYPDCYELVYKSRDSSTSLPVKTSSDFETTSSLFSTTSDQSESNQLPLYAIIIITVIVTIAVSSGITFAVIFCRRKRRKIRKRRISIDDRKEEDEDTAQLLLKRSIEDTIARKQIPMETITDKYSFAVHRTEDDLREENIEESNRYLRSFRTFDKYFAETHTYKKAHDYLEKYNIVVLTGPPGCGKTHIARHLMFEASSQDRIVHKIRSWEEFSLTNLEVQSLVFIDNIFYDNLINYDLVNWWKTLEGCFNNCRKRGGEDVTTRPIDPLKVIITAREHVIENACSFMNAVTPLFNENYIISGDDFRCSDEEKELIFRKQMEYAEKEKHIPSHTIDAQFLREIKSSEGPIGFPFCAHLYACKEEYKRRGARFFSHPTEFLKLQTEFEIENDKSCKTKTLFLVLFLFEWHLKKCDPHRKLDLENEVLCRRFVNSYSPDVMQYFSPLDFKGLSTIARKLTGPFFIEVEKGFKFVHDSVYEAVGEFFCEKYFDQTTQLFPLDVISNHVYASLTEKQTKTLALRFLYEALNQNLSKIYTCDIFKKKSFVKTFCDELNMKGENVVRCFLMIENDSSSVKLPSIFWTSRCKLPYLTDLLYEMILKEKEIDADYHMYLSLFGECCAKNEHLLGTVNGMLRNDLEEIKKRVHKFVDDEENSILHLIIMSDRSDACVAQAVKKITETGLSVNCRNKMNITPLMVAVKHCGPRKDVVRQLCERGPEIKLRDTNCSSIFHHCLSSENDDETCLEYLRIILEKASNKRILNESDENGENALNMAAKQSRYSRILCILTLMGIEEVKATIDLDGNTPIHNAIKHLKGKNKNPLLARLECCVRIILFIARDVDPEQVADDKKRPIDLCNDECVERILKAHSTFEVAEKVFITLLNEIKLKYEKKENEEVTGPLEFPAKIQKELKSHIEEAVKYLRNADFDKTYMNT